MADMKLSDWMALAVDATTEIATGALGMGNVQWRHPVEGDMPDNLCGVYIPLMTDGFSVQLGVLGQPEVCTHLAKSLLGMGPDESLADEHEVFDAVGEVMNLVAGSVKSRAADLTNVTLGLPLALTGTVFPLGGAAFERGLMRMDDNDVWLVIAGAPMA